MEYGLPKRETIGKCLIEYSGEFIAKFIVDFPTCAQKCTDLCIDESLSPTSDANNRKIISRSSAGIDKYKRRASSEILVFTADISKFEFAIIQH